jgi:hypothetical protein
MRLGEGFFVDLLEWTSEREGAGGDEEQTGDGTDVQAST